MPGGHRDTGAPGSWSSDGVRLSSHYGTRDREAREEKTPWEETGRQKEQPEYSQDT